MGGLILGTACLAMVIAAGTRFRKRTGLSSRSREEMKGGRQGHARPLSIEYQSHDVAETYDRRRFHSLGGRYNNWRLHRLLNSILQRLPRGSVVLDIPCGTGRIDHCLLERSLRVIAADISTAMLTVARQKFRPRPAALEFLRADAYDLPFRSHSVHAVLCIRFLHLMDPPERCRVLAEMARVAAHWAIIEYRNLDPSVKALKRAIVSWLSGVEGRERRTISAIDDELHRCGLRADHYYFVSRWFSGSVLVVAHHQESGAVIVRKSFTRRRFAWRSGVRS